MPAKVFLEKPYPNDLPVLPACRCCNNGFSEDELYVKMYIDSLKYLSGYGSSLKKHTLENLKKNTAFLDAQSDLSRYYDGKSLPTNQRIERILTKLAIGHMVYELSEGYSDNGRYTKPKQISYSFLLNMPKSEVESFDDFIIMTDKKVPTIGSRVYDKIYVLESALRHVDKRENKKLQMLLMTWSDIQEYNYKYIAWMENNCTFHVKIVIHDFLFAEIIFDQKTEA